MNSMYLLLAAGVLAIVFGLRRLLSTRQKRILSPFHQGRVFPPESSSSEMSERERAEAGLMKIAGELPDSQRVQNKSVSFSSHNREQNGLTAETLTSTATMKPTLSNRRSTWNDRKLFSEFRGILSDDTEAVSLPAPEELPIANEDFVFGSLTPSIAQLLPESESRREVQRKALIGAGYHSRAAWLNLSAIRFALSFLSLVVVGLWLIAAPPAIEPWLLGLLVMAPLFMWALPPLVVSFQAAERKIDIERGLPDVLDMMNMGISQGLTVPQSLRRISHEISEAHPALSAELHIVNQQAQVGNLSHALRSFAQRIESTEVNSFTSLLVQSETTGTSIARALTDYSDSIRATLKERADARANAASFKLLFPVALFLMPSVFLFLLGPAIVQMSDFFNNQAEVLQQDRQNAVRSLDQQPQLDLRRFQQDGGALNVQP
ncbi:MAG: type II secretion system F family protein [Planctomycetota bacterium]